MKKVLMIILMSVCTLLFVSCGTEDQVKLDVYQYLNTDVKPISLMHNEAIASYNKYMDKDDADTEQLLDELTTEIIPTMKQVSTSLGELSYTSSEVNTYAIKYKTVVDQEIQALESVVSAVENKSEEELATANTNIGDAMHAMDVYQTEIRTFAASYGLTLVEKE